MPIAREPTGVAAAAALVGLRLDPADAPAITAHLEVLLDFVDILGESADEPAMVFRA